MMTFEITWYMLPYFDDISKCMLYLLSLEPLGIYIKDQTHIHIYKYIYAYVCDCTDIERVTKCLSPLGHCIIAKKKKRIPSHGHLRMTCQLLEDCICIAAVLISTASFTMSTPQTKSKPCLANSTKFSPDCSVLNGSMLMPTTTDPHLLKK